MEEQQQQTDQNNSAFHFNEEVGTFWDFPFACVIRHAPWRHAPARIIQYGYSLCRQIRRYKSCTLTLYYYFFHTNPVLFLSHWVIVTAFLFFINLCTRCHVTAACKRSVCGSGLASYANNNDNRKRKRPSCLLSLSSSSVELNDIKLSTAV